MSALSIVSSVAGNLGSLVVEEGKFLFGVREQVEQMQIELELMQTYLEDADRKQSQDKRVKAWVSRIREATYDVEDVIETFALKFESRRRGGSFKNALKRYSCLINDAADLHEVGSKIEAIKTRISNLTRCLNTYGIKNITFGEEGSRSRQLQQWRQSYSHDVEEFTVGLDKDVQNLVGKLVNEDYCGVVSICGMGGQGKTTLAKKVYHHEEIRHHFDGFAWSFASQQFQPRNIWEGILCQLISPSKEEREEILKYKDAEVAKKLYEVQQEKKCLVILDDIWTTEAWDRLCLAFPVGKAAGTKILLTTRNTEVGMHVDQTGLHEPHLLTEEEAWELLQKKALPQESGMEELGRQMVERCGRSPLAIVVLGGLLATKPTLNEWKIVLENFISYLRKDEDIEQQYYSQIHEVLALSYNELPFQLKPCFLHLSHFPEDFDIPTEKLVNMWVAEGIVSSMHYEVEGEETLEDIAEHCLGQLLDRCILQVGRRRSRGRIKTCRLHDLLRDLCLLKANEENFLQIVHNHDGNEPVSRSHFSLVTSTKQIRQIRRLAIYVGKVDDNISWERKGTSTLRSLLFFSPHDSHNLILEKIIARVNNCILLKTLDLEECRKISGKLPKAIGNLVHLRYLSLNCSHKINISSSIGNLSCLQILILNGDYRIRVPNVIWRMEGLRYLCLPSNINKSSGKLGLGNLRELQTLKYLDARIFDLKELTQWSNLRNLYLVKEIEKLPGYSQFPPSLTKLTLEYSELHEDPMATLEKLLNLSVLHLLSNSFMGKKLTCSAKGFPQLKSLVLDGLSNLEEWHVGEGAMPNLSNLLIENCCELKMVPDGLRFIATLRELLTIGMPKEFENRLKEGGEDFAKVQHVPSIILKWSPFYDSV